MSKKTFLTGLFAGVIMLAANLIVGWVFNFIFPSIGVEYQNADIFRPWADPLMFLFFLHPFVLGVVLALAWTKTKQMFMEQTEWKRGAKFGFAYWVLTLPGMVISYGTFPLSFVMILSWTITSLVASIAGGIVFARMLK